MQCFKQTCPIINNHAKEIEKDIDNLILFYLEDLTKKLHGSYNITLKSSKELYDEYFKEHIEELRDLNSEMREFYERQIEELEDQIEELKEEIND